MKYCNLIGHSKGFKSLINLVIFTYYPAISLITPVISPDSSGCTVYG